VLTQHTLLESAMKIDTIIISNSDRLTSNIVGETPQGTKTRIPKGEAIYKLDIVGECAQGTKTRISMLSC
jgi:hypothetical protein